MEPVETTAVAKPATTAETKPATTPVIEELLIEEISIDGMCGVY